MSPVIAAQESVDGSRSIGVVPNLILSRGFGIAFGVSSQLLFFMTVVHLFWFLRDGSTSIGLPNFTAHVNVTFGLFLDVLLACFFAWPHSLLLMPSTQKRIKAHMPSAWMGCLHCFATCVSLLALFAMWYQTEGALWHFTGSAAMAMKFCFYGSWVMLFYSLYWTGFAYQTGLYPWLQWALGKAPPKRVFVERGPYRWMRHPVYLSFLGLIWFTPVMTWDHVILTIVWTSYIFVGSYFKDRRLLFYLGKTYRDYARRVSGYPVIGIGPMGRIK